MQGIDQVTSARKQYVDDFLRNLDLSPCIRLIKTDYKWQEVYDRLCDLDRDVATVDKADTELFWSHLRESHGMLGDYPRPAITGVNIRFNALIPFIKQQAQLLQAQRLPDDSIFIEVHSVPGNTELALVFARQRYKLVNLITGRVVNVKDSVTDPENWFEDKYTSVNAVCGVYDLGEPRDVWMRMRLNFLETDDTEQTLDMKRFFDMIYRVLSHPDVRLGRAADRLESQEQSLMEAWFHPLELVGTIPAAVGDRGFNYYAFRRKMSDSFFFAGTRMMIHIKAPTYIDASNAFHRHMRWSAVNRPMSPQEQRTKVLSGLLQWIEKDVPCVKFLTDHHRWRDARCDWEACLYSQEVLDRNREVIMAFALHAAELLAVALRANHDTLDQQSIESHGNVTMPYTILAPALRLLCESLRNRGMRPGSILIRVTPEQETIRDRYSLNRAMDGSEVHDPIQIHQRAQVEVRQTYDLVDSLTGQMLAPAHGTRLGENLFIGDFTKTTVVAALYPEAGPHLDSYHRLRANFVEPVESSTGDNALCYHPMALSEWCQDCTKKDKSSASRVVVDQVYTQKEGTFLLGHSLDHRVRSNQVAPQTAEQEARVITLFFRPLQLVGMFNAPPNHLFWKFYIFKSHFPGVFLIACAHKYWRVKASSREEAFATFADCLNKAALAETMSDTETTMPLSVRTITRMLNKKDTEMHISVDAKSLYTQLGENWLKQFGEPGDLLRVMYKKEDRRFGFFDLPELARRPNENEGVHFARGKFRHAILKSFVLIKNPVDWIRFISMERSNDTIRGKLSILRPIAEKANKDFDMKDLRDVPVLVENEKL